MQTYWFEAKLITEFDGHYGTEFVKEKIQAADQIVACKRFMKIVNGVAGVAKKRGFDVALFEMTTTCMD
jgi:hypothetical protein